MFVLRVKEREKLCAVRADSVSVAGHSRGGESILTSLKKGVSSSYSIADMPVMKVRRITEIKERSKVRM